MGQDMSRRGHFVAPGAQRGMAQTTVHIHQGVPVQQTCTTTTQGQPVHGMPMQQGMATTVVTTPVQPLNIGNRRKTAAVGCCGHTMSWTLLGLGIAMLITGVVLTAVFAEDIRTPRIDAYNEYVRDWGTFLADEKYLEPKFNVYSEITCRAEDGVHDVRSKAYNVLLGLTTNRTDILEDTKSGKSKPLPLEPQHKWRTKVVFTDEDVGGYLAADRCAINTNITEGDQGTAEETKILSFSHPLREWRFFSCGGDDRGKCAHKCSTKHDGHYDWNTNMCMYPMVMDQICVKVKTIQKEGRLVYVADESFPGVDRPEGSSGCYYSREKKYFRHRHFYNSGKPIEHTGLPLTYDVRYSKDAWLGYMRVTGNSGDFGDNNEPGLIAGIILLIFGVVFTLGFFYLFFFVVLRRVRRINAMEDNTQQQSTCLVAVW